MERTIDFAKAPFLLIWETTRSCGLACKHCRAEADETRHPGELTTEEGKALLDETAAMGTPICILSGGDPLNRADLEELVAHGVSKGLRMGTIPAATSNLTRERLAKLKAAGLSQVAFSIDGPTETLHDKFRNTPGAYAKTMQGIAWAHEVGLPVQINTVLAEWNYPLLDSLIALVRSLRIVFWEVFFLIPVGRGKDMEALQPEQFEQAFARLRQVSLEEPFVVKLTEGQHYKRFVLKQELENGRAGRPMRPMPAKLGMHHSPIGASPVAVNAGKGFVFVDHLGNICPSGFLPLTAGNVRTDSVTKVYRESPLFTDLRDPRKLKGKCGACEFASLCGGSRARAWAVTGDYFESDPSCGYVPQGSKAALP